jgi:peptidoglycan/LPS O-acetylase OafA/YrhL
MVFPVIGQFPFRGHMPEVLVLTLIFSIAIAAVSYALVESPCREALRRWESRNKKPTAPGTGGAVSPRQEDAIAP